MNNVRTKQSPKKQTRCRISKNVVEDNRAWSGMQTFECELPKIDYEGSSNEKKEQEQRENKVLQIFFFNN